MARKAIAYVSDIVLGQSGEVISRQAQRESLRRHAAENGIEIVAYYEDEVYSEDVLSRPGIQKLLACEECYDDVLVDRVWSLSRQWSTLVVFLKEIQRRGKRVESAACLWDCVSQQARHYFRPGYKPLGGAVCSPAVLEQAQPVAVHKPSRLNFVFLKRRPVHS